MALVNRISRLFTADVHAVLDRIEEPDVLLRHAMREMEEELARSEQRLKALEHERETIIARAARIEASLPELDEKLDVCFTSGNDDLARKLIRRRLEAERIGRHLASRRETSEKALAQARTSLAEGRERLEHIRQKAEVMTESSHAAGAPWEQEAWGSADASIGDDEVEVAFLREKQRRARS